MTIRAQNRVLQAIIQEREAQDTKWGEQNHPDISPYLGGMRLPAMVATYYGIPTEELGKRNCQMEFARNEGSWFSIHVEELSEALRAAVQGDTVALRTELVQLAATVTAHIEAIDRRGN